MRRSRHAISTIEMLTVLGLIGLLIALLLPAVQKAREAANRARCRSNLRQVGLGLHQYHTAFGELPPGTATGIAEPLPYLAWSARISPFLEQDAYWQATFDAFRLERRFWNPPHPIGHSIRIFVCPSDGRPAVVLSGAYSRSVALTWYLGVNGSNRIRRDGSLFHNSHTQLASITDGTSNTLLVGERPPSSDYRYGWIYAGVGLQGDGTSDATLGVREYLQGRHCGRVRARFMPGDPKNPCDSYHFWSLHPGGAHFLFADGSCRFLRYDNSELMAALASISGGEIVSLAD